MRWRTPRCGRPGKATRTSGWKLARERGFGRSAPEPAAVVGDGDGAARMTWQRPRRPNNRRAIQSIPLLGMAACRGPPLS